MVSASLACATDVAPVGNSAANSSALTATRIGLGQRRACGPFVTSRWDSIGLDDDMRGSLDKVVRQLKMLALNGNFAKQLG